MSFEKLDEKQRATLNDNRQDKEYKDKELMWLNSERFHEKEI